MNRKTLYATLAGCAAFIAVFSLSFWYFSPPAAPTPAGTGSAAQTDAPRPVYETGQMQPQPASTATGNMAPANTVQAAPSPTAYGAALKGGAPSSQIGRSPEDAKKVKRTSRALDPNRKLSKKERRLIRSENE